jgi:SAM-dependent methyltransferase
VLYTIRSVLRRALSPRCHNHRLFAAAVADKRGLEIGGPSSIFRKRLPIYAVVASLDNCNFSNSTVWSQHGGEYCFSPKKPAGREFVTDATQMSSFRNDAYDVILSSHNLEHIANPVMALKEWRRIARTLVLVIPEYRHTFDWRRTPTAVEHMLLDYQNGVGEDDLSHLPEILALHDLTRDKAAGTHQQFAARSRRNLENRCLHHHVFDTRNIRELLEAVDFHVDVVETSPPYHICVLAQRN